jgi:murein DD-endopeptidase MepM/ murein hydrolase activator NlpD
MATLTQSSRLARTALVALAGALSAVPIALGNPAEAQSPEQSPESVHGTVTLAPTRDISCPIPAGSEFIDSWGAGRSGGRRHKGVDMIGDRGPPIVAAQTGAINFKRNRLGGNAAWLTTSLGNKFYYAHLNSFEGDSRDVREGDVIGYVGSSGNAKGPHLHFEVHFEGQVGNPYPATFEACVQPQIDAMEARDAALKAQPSIPKPGSAAASLANQRAANQRAANQRTINILRF